MNRVSALGTRCALAVGGIAAGSCLGNGTEARWEPKTASAVDLELPRLKQKFRSIDSASEGELSRPQFAELFAELSIDLQQLPHELMPIDKPQEPEPEKPPKAASTDLPPSPGWWQQLFAPAADAEAKSTPMLPVPAEKARFQQVVLQPERVVGVAKRLLSNSTNVRFGYFENFVSREQNRSSRIDWQSFATGVRELMQSDAATKHRLEFRALRTAGESEDTLSVRSLRKCVRDPFELFIKDLSQEYLLEELRQAFPAAADSRLHGAAKRLKPQVSRQLQAAADTEFERLLNDLGADVNGRLLLGQSSGAGTCLNGDPRTEQKVMEALEAACVFPSDQSLRATARLLDHLNSQLYASACSSSSGGNRDSGSGGMTLAEAMAAQISTEMSSLRKHVVLGAPLLVVGSVGAYCTSLLLINPSATLAVLNMLGPLQQQARVAMQRFGGFSICFVVGGIKELFEAALLLSKTEALGEVWRY